MFQDPANFVSKISQGTGAQAVDVLENLKNNLSQGRPENFEDCVVWARNQFEVSAR